MTGWPRPRPQTRSVKRWTKPRPEAVAEVTELLDVAQTTPKDPPHLTVTVTSNPV